MATAASALAKLAAAGLTRAERGKGTFVPRDIGAAVKSWMDSAGANGGFLLLVGNSAVGKTRLLYETAREVLPGFTVLVPDLGDGGLVNSIAESTYPLPKLIVWLDELQRFLPGPYVVHDEHSGHTPITAAAIRHLLASDTPVVIVGTLWPEYLHHLRATETDPATGGQRHRHQQAVDILSPAHNLLTVLPFNDAERGRAADLARHDPRLADAHAYQDFNITEALAGVPQILRRYHQGTDTQHALVHAAVDARRLGIQAPLAPDLLRAAARGYLTAVYPDDIWFDPALTDLTSRNRRDDAATAPLLPVLTPDRRDILGYTVTDPLLQHLTQRRRTEPLPRLTWQALTEHITSHDDLTRLADHAARRLLYDQAQAAYQRLVDTDDRYAAYRLAELLAKQGRTDEAIEVLRPRADASDWGAGDRLLIDLLAERGRVDDLRARADTGDEDAADRLADLLAERGRVDDLRARADAGDLSAAHRLVELLAEQGRIDEAVEVLRARADTGDEDAADLLAELLAEQGRIDDALALLRRRADAGDLSAANGLADLLAKQGRIDEAIEVLRARADTGDEEAANGLVELLAKHGRTDDLRARADAGDLSAAHRLVELLAKRGRIDDLRAEMLAGTPSASARFIALLEDQGQSELANRMRRFGLKPDGSIADG